MLVIPTAVCVQMAAHGAAAYPEEGCGLLLGRAEPEVTRVAAALPTPNTWPDSAERRVRFRIDARDWLAAELEADRRGLEIVGVFHSHPDHPPIASPRDLAWATWPGLSYVITEIRHGRAVGSRSWLLNADRSGFAEQPIAVEGSSPVPAPERENETV